MIIKINQALNKAPRFSYGYLIVVTTFSIMALAQGSYVVFGVFFEPLLQKFGWTRAAVSGAYSLSSILSGVLAIVMGGFTDRLGPRPVVAFCGFCLGLGYLLMSQVNALWHLYLFYGVIVGIGMSGLWVPLLSSIARWFTQTRSLMTGIAISGLTVGQLIAPLVISRLIAAHGWRLSCSILGGVLLLTIVLAAQFLKRDPGQTSLLPHSNDKEKQQIPQSNNRDLTLKEAAHTTQFWLAAITFFCVGFAAFAVLVHIVPHATRLVLGEKR